MKLRSFISLIIVLSVSVYLVSCSSALGAGTDSNAAISQSTQSIIQGQTDISTSIIETTITVTPTPTPTPTLIPEPEHVLVSFLGDCTLGEPLTWDGSESGFDSVVGGDMNYCFQNSADILSSDDMTLANLEGTFTDATSHLDKEFVFGSPSEYCEMLVNGSVECVNLANNHTYDYLDEGLADTQETLTSYGVVWSNEYTIATYEVRGVLIGMAGTSFSSYSQTMFDAIDDMKAMGCNIIIISCHWGYERDYEPRAEQTDLGHQLIDYGADIVVDTHPHRLQPIEEYNGKYILYSISNFVFGGNTYLSDPDTAIVQCEFIMDSTNTYVEEYRINVIPFRQTTNYPGNDYCPTPYTWGSDEYYRVMQRLNWVQEDE